MASLVEQAQAMGSLRTKTPYSKEELELVIAFLEGDVSLRQYGTVMGLTNPGSATHRISALLKHAYTKKWITINVT